MKLILANDHLLFRDALAHYLKCAAPNASIEFAKDTKTLHAILNKNVIYDLALLDLKLLGLNGLRGVSYLRNHYPETRLAIISGAEDSKYIKHAVELGVAGYFPKTLSSGELIGGIKYILKGGIFMPSGHSDKAMMTDSHKNDYVADPFIVRNVGLTNREQDVLEHLTEGKTNRDIARALGVQIVTIKLHMRGICRKLGAANRTQAAVLAKDLGLV